VSVLLRSHSKINLGRFVDNTSLLTLSQAAVIPIQVSYDVGWKFALEILYVLERRSLIDSVSIPAALIGRPRFELPLTLHEYLLHFDTVERGGGRLQVKL
jgi:hypothetical protein